MQNDLWKECFFLQGFLISILIQQFEKLSYLIKKINKLKSHLEEVCQILYCRKSLKEACFQTTVGAREGTTCGSGMVNKFCCYRKTQFK